MYSQYHLQRQPQASPYQPQVAPPPSSASGDSHTSSTASSPMVSFSDSRSTQGHGSDLVGRPIHFSTGPYTGMVIRMELHEIQKANLGRKYARVDRRPLDPPPVAQLKMFEVYHSGTSKEFEREMAYDDVQVLGLLCTVDLFPVPAQEPFDSPPGRECFGRPTSTPHPNPPFFSSPSPSSSSSAYSSELNAYSNYLHPQNHGTPSTPPARPSQNHFSGYILPPRGTPDVVHQWGTFPITETSKETQALVGATFVQPHIVDYQGSKAIVFVFGDLAVKIEGTFILRYRVFDIFAKPFSASNDLAITAECYGGLFRVYSTKEFPGLSASTELTKLLARWGVRLNIRETERRRRKRPASPDGRRSPTPDDIN